MSRHMLNCFSIENAGELTAEYRLVDVEGPFDSERSDGDLAERNLQHLVRRIQFQEQIPVAIRRAGKDIALAIPASHELRRTEYDLAPDVASLRPRVETEEVCFGNPGPGQAGIALAFLGFCLRTPLRSDNRLWSPSPWSYMWRRPINYRDDTRGVDVYRGFGLRLGYREGQLCLWVKLTHRYVESAWLPDAHGEAEIRQDLQMRYALYHYGNRWYPVQLMGPTGKSIAEQRFMPEGAAQPISVYDYTMDQVGGRNAPSWIESLDPNSAAITYRSPGNEKKRYGASSLCKLMLATEDPRVGSLHRLSILDPDRRFAEMKRVMESFFQSCSFEDSAVRVSTEPVIVPRRVFAVPRRSSARAGSFASAATRPPGRSNSGTSGRSDSRCSSTRTGGWPSPAHSMRKDLLVPESQERQIVEDFQDRLEKAARGIPPAQLHVQAGALPGPRRADSQAAGRCASSPRSIRRVYPAAAGVLMLPATRTATCTIS